MQDDLEESTLNANRILVGFAEALSAIEVVASLAEAGYEVHCFSREHALTALQFGAYGQRLYRVIAPEASLSCCIDELAGLWRELGTPPFFALDDASLLLSAKLEGMLPGFVHIGAAGEAVTLAIDKVTQIAFAKQLGFLVPNTVVDPVVAPFEYHFYAKGRFAAEDRDGRLVRVAARAIRTQVDWEQFVVQAGGSPIMAQETIVGVGCGIFGISDSGSLLAVSGHMRVRMMNPDGSGSSACRSRSLSEIESTAAKKFVKMSVWNGLFMIELLQDDYGQLWFMELNGRPWGSMSLARLSGFDYPAWACHLKLHGQLFNGLLENFPKKTIECRHLGREAIHFLHLFLRVGKRGGLSRLLSGVRSFFSSQADEIRWYNKQAIGWRLFLADSFFCLARHSDSSIVGRCIVAPDLIGRKFALAWRRLRRRSEKKAISSALDGATIITIACFGNINRSALAGALLNKKAIQGIKFLSCGLYRRFGRHVDPAMLEVGLRQGVDMTEHRSTIFSREHAVGSDVIFVMQEWHRLWIEDRYPTARGKIFLFGSLIDGYGEVVDPYGCDKGTYQYVGEKIGTCVDHLVNKIHCSQLKASNG